jgi:hypothetical protein
MVEVLPWSLAGSTLPCVVIQADRPLSLSQIVTKHFRQAPLGACSAEIGKPGFKNLQRPKKRAA